MGLQMLNMHQRGHLKYLKGEVGVYIMLVLLMFYICALYELLLDITLPENSGKNAYCILKTLIRNKYT